MVSQTPEDDDLDLQDDADGFDALCEGGDSGGNGVGESDVFAGLSHRQSLAVMALLSEPSLERAAFKVGATPRSLHRWMCLPEFQQAYRHARRQAYNQAVGLVVKYSTLAVSTMVKVMADETASHSARVSAAAAMLKFGRDGIQIDDIAGRIDAIEQELQMTESSPRTLRGRLGGG